MDWGFYGRNEELKRLQAIFTRRRWFFAKIMGRRRIGKTTLIQHARLEGALLFYCQIPDSGPAGVLSAVRDAMDMFAIPVADHPRPTSLAQLASTISRLARASYVVVLDEFQYFNRERLRDFASLLQAEVDQLTANAPNVPGGLIVLGSIHTEMSAILEDRSAPLYSRVTDELQLGHLDIESLCEVVEAHGGWDPERFLFLWNLFEGVPKFYRDCFEQGVLGAPRRELLEKVFFLSSSPLRSEAEHWFLKELHGRYDVILKFVARHPGCTHGDLTQHVRHVSSDSDEQVGGYLKVLIERYGMIEKKLPVFAKAKAKRGRYYLTDNFLRAWLSALAGPVAAVNFKPVPTLVDEADRRLHDCEGPSLERLVGQLYAERSRKGVGDFPLTQQVQGYWDGGETELDLVAISDDARRIRFGSCKRSRERLVADVPAFEAHIARFLVAFPEYASWKIEKVGLSPTLDTQTRDALRRAGWGAEDLSDLTAPLRRARTGLVGVRAAGQGGNS